MQKRGENIYERKDGRWEARYVKEIAPDGKKLYGSVYASSYEEAREKQQWIISRTNIRNNTALYDAYRLWIAGVRLDSKPNTVAKYEGVFKNHISCLKDIPVSDFDRSILTNFTAGLQGKGLCNKTINDILIILNMILSFASEEYEVHMPKIKYLREEHKKTRCLSVFEQKQLIDYLKEDIDIHKFGTLLAMYTGLRIGELCALKWEDISGGTISVTKTMTRVKVKEKSEVIITPPKSNSSVRVLPYPLELVKYYNMFKSEGYVLSNKRLVFTEPRYLQMAFSCYVKDCGLKDVTFHTLRHTFATRCIEAGVDAKTVSELLGHADTKITLNRYVHPSFELKQNSIDKMQKLLV